LDPDGNAEIQTKETTADSEQKLYTSARWQLLDNRTLSLSGTQSAHCKILKLTAWRMTTVSPADFGFSIQWVKQPTINAKAWLLISAAMVLPVVFALSLPRSKSSHTVAEDPQWVPSTTLRHRH
jgi:hypothetical protein